MQQVVRHRHVFYIDGFDPKGVPAFYQSHRGQLQKYARLTGTAHALSERVKTSRYSHAWTVKADHTPAPTHTTFEYLVWDDIVRSHWARTPAAIARQAWRCFRDFALSGVIRPLYRLAPATVRAALIPYFLTLLTALGVVCASGAAYLVLAWLKAGLLAALVGSLVTMAVTASFGWRALKNTPSMWFFRVVDFANTLARQKDAKIDARITAWTDRILDVLQTSGADEVVVLGYSAGSSLSVQLMAQIARRQPSGAAAQHGMVLLTLGNCIPAVAALKSGQQMRLDLATVGQSQCGWLDYTSPIDWSAFPMVNPISVYTPESDMTPQNRRFASPRFHLLFESENYRKIRRDKYHVHQLYIQCPPKTGHYDFFDMIYGQHSVLQRIAA